jgi:hypothetical protein
VIFLVGLHGLFRSKCVLIQFLRSLLLLSRTKIVFCSSVGCVISEQLILNLFFVILTSFQLSDFIFCRCVITVLLFLAYIIKKRKEHSKPQLYSNNYKWQLHV